MFIVYRNNIIVKLSGRLFSDTINGMVKKKRGRGRPPKDADKLRSEALLVRLDGGEKEAFREAATLAGVSLASWVRERLRQIAIKELGKAERPIAFLR
jgi:predicted HicB family RNase H-like nuclease